MYARHCSFVFDSNGQLCLQTRHGGISLDCETLFRRTRRILRPRSLVSIGPYCYEFAFDVANQNHEARVTEAKRVFIRQYITEEPLHSQVSATPSISDVVIEDWVLHGIVGRSPVSVI